MYRANSDIPQFGDPCISTTILGVPSAVRVIDHTSLVRRRGRTNYDDVMRFS